MIKLSPLDEPRWLELARGVRVRVKPLALTGLTIARDAASRAAKEASPEDLTAVLRAAFAVSLAQWAIVEWDGIGDEDDNVLPATKENVLALFVDARNYDVYDSFDELYIRPALILGNESKKSGRSPNGTGAGPIPARPTAADAEGNANSAPTGSSLN